MYKKMIVGLDGSLPSAHALQHAVDLAKKVGTEKITILHINKDLPLQEPLYNIDLDQILAEEDREILLPAIQLLSESGVYYESHSYHGDPATVLTKYAKEHEYDVILLGNTGKGLIKEALLGSVSHKVIQDSDCPVIIVK